MKSQAKIPVNVLPEKEAWHLFKEKAGDVVDSSELHVVAKEVVKECGGLPLAIITLGMALQDKDKKVWDHALLQLQRSNPTNIKGMDQKVFSSLEMSYNYLESKEAQLCFLFCCLFPEGYSINEKEMMIYGMGEGLFKDVDTLEEASCRVHMLFDKLKATCLLLEGDRSNSVKMHDIVRDVALSIALRAEHGFLVKAKVGWKEWPHIENVQECKRISLANNEISKLPDQIECPRLLTLILESNQSLKEIPNGFFQGMNSLKVLDICGSNISMLPPSLEGLKNLRSLWLDRCPQLKDVTLVGGLKKLEILCLQETGICELTEKMGELHNLKLLDLMHSNSLEMIAPNVISRMTYLEELRMGNRFGKWELMGNGDARQASLAEMASLSRLTVLYIHVENVECLSQDIPGSWKNLKKFRICVGRDYTDSKAERSIKIENSPCPKAKWVEVLFNRTYELELVRCEGLDNLMQSHGLSFNSLEILLIKECGEMEHFLIVVEEEPLRNVFKNLKVLSLDELMNLKMFCRGPLLADSFQNLRNLNIFHCHKLINIMPSDLLQSLEELDVSHCHELVEVFNFQGTSKEDALLSKLRKLKLYDLPELTSIWKGAIPPLGSHHHLEFVSVRYCRRLRYLVSPALAERLQLLKDLHIRYCEKMEKLIGVEVEESRNASLSSSSGSRQSELMCPLHSLPHGRMFHNLQTLYISQCHSFKNLFSLSVAQGLFQLEHLCIFDCKGMEVIIEKEADDEVVDQGMLPRLRTLELWVLDQLTSFYQGVGVLFDWPSLEYLHVGRCQNFKKIQMGTHSAPNLKRFSSTKEWLEEVEWEDESLKARIQPLIHLVE
ncbi:disease resistance protein At4g27190-like [Magnolia sinica]|uniref:disease resistance protein At4g27190-like n=1 Tax=Magnolia sinica TaxID=86752 RepID=UPI00265A516D|nr:disease resistance protein At4g27190-like [Magnolia sinica]